MSFLQNFCQTYTQCRHNSLNYCNGNMLFLQWKVIWVQSLIFFRNISLTRFFSCSQLRESSQQPQLWCHFVFKVNFEEGFLPSKIFCGLLTMILVLLVLFYCLTGFYMLRRLAFLQQLLKSMQYTVEVKQNCKYLFIFLFQISFLYKPATVNLGKAETFLLGSTTG